MKYRRKIKTIPACRIHGRPLVGGPCPACKHIRGLKLEAENLRQKEERSIIEPNPPKKKPMISAWYGEDRPRHMLTKKLPVFTGMIDWGRCPDCGTRLFKDGRGVGCQACGFRLSAKEVKKILETHLGQQTIATTEVVQVEAPSASKVSGKSIWDALEKVRGEA